MPSPSTSKPALRVRVGMQNTSPAAKYGGVSTHGFAPVNTTSPRSPSLSTSCSSVAALRAVADDQHGGVGHPPLDQRQRPDQHVLALARDQPRDAHDHGSVAEPVGGPHRGTVDARVERLRRRRPGVSCTMRAPAFGRERLARCGAACRCRGRSARRCVSPMRRSIARVPGVLAHQTSCPCVVATVRRTPAARLELVRHQTQRCGGAEPDRVAAHLAGDARSSAR